MRCQDVNWAWVTKFCVCMCVAEGNNYLGKLIPLRSKTCCGWLPSKAFLIPRRTRLHVIVKSAPACSTAGSTAGMALGDKASKEGAALQPLPWPLRAPRAGHRSQGWMLEQACRNPPRAAVSNDSCSVEQAAAQGAATRGCRVAELLFTAHLPREGLFLVTWVC